MRIERAIPATLFVVAAIALASCGPLAGSAPAPRIKLGLLADLSGPKAEVGVDVRRGAELAVAEINEARGINGQRVELVVEDDAGIPERGSDAARRLIVADKVAAIVGSVDPAVNQATMEVAKEAQTVQLSPVDAADVSTQSGNPFYFRLGTKDSDLARMLARYAGKRYRNISVIFDTTTWDAYGVQALINELSAGGNPAISIHPHASKAADFGAAVYESQRAGAGAVIIWATGGDAAAMVRHMRTVGFKADVVGGPGLAMRSFPVLARELADGAVFGDTLAPDKPKAKRFIDTYEKAYVEPLNVDWAAKSYDSVSILSEGLKRAGLARHRLKDALETITNFEGVSGPSGAKLGFSPDKHVGLGEDAILFKAWRGDRTAKIKM